MRGPATICTGFAGLVIGACSPPGGPGSSRFTEVTAASGFTVAHARPGGCPTSERAFCEVDRMTGGAAAGDADADGWVDLFVTSLSGADRLYRNRGDGTFSDVTEASGLSGFGGTGNGAAFVDVDGDGDLDLYVTTLGPAAVASRHLLFINDGGGRFTEEARARNVALDDGLAHAGQSVAAGDFDGDGFVDLHVTEWLPGTGPRPHTRLLRNRGAAAPGFFDDVTESSGALTFSRACWSGEERCTSTTFASAFSDLDADGRADLLVVEDFGLTRLFWNRGDGHFEPGARSTAQLSDENGMGSTVGDFDGDGQLDWFVSAIHDRESSCALGRCGWGTSGNRLYRYAGDRSFVDATDAAAVREGGWGWGAAFFDSDNDGDLDLVAAAGMTHEGLLVGERFETDPMRLWENDGRGAMTERAERAGLADARQGRGLLVFDYDADGDLNLFVARNGELPRLYRNDSAGGGFLRVRCLGAGGNSEALGARIWLRSLATGKTQVREVGSVSHFLGQSERVAHFGLGAGAEGGVELEVRWPGGRVSRLRGVQPNQTLTLTQPVD